MGMIFVTNHNPDTHTDAYDGVEYVFPPGERVMIDTDAATHMLGYNLRDKTETLIRVGKAIKYDPVTKAYADDPEGVRWLANFMIEKAVMVPEKSSLARALEKPAPA